MTPEAELQRHKQTGFIKVFLKLLLPLVIRSPPNQLTFKMCSMQTLLFEGIWGNFINETKLLSLTTPRPPPIYISGYTLVNPNLESYRQTHSLTHLFMRWHILLQCLIPYWSIWRAFANNWYSPLYYPPPKKRNRINLFLLFKHLLKYKWT